MDIEESFLPNNLRVITGKTPGAAASVGAFVNIGTRHETEANPGIAHFLEHMAFKGTTKRTAFDIANEIEIVGGYSNAMTGTCHTAYYSKGLAEHMPLATDILGDVLTDSKYDNDDIRLESGVITQEIAQYEDDPFSTMVELLTETAYPNQPVGRKVLGTREFVANAEPHHFRDFVGTNYSAETMLVVATGGIEHAEIVDAAVKAFANIPATTARTKVVPATYVGGLGIDTSKDFVQASVGITWQSVPTCDASMYTHKLLSSAFGEGMSSPLFTEIREKRGLVYHTSAHAEFEADYGNVSVFGLLTPENIDEFIKVACHEFAKMCETVNENDLIRAKNGWLVQLAFMEESATSMMHFIANQMFYYGRIKTFDEIRQSIKKVTIDDVKAAAKRLLSSKPTIALVGPIPDGDYEGIIKAALGA
jgi:predicted Zn-dependent peptidase